MHLVEVVEEAAALLATKIARMQQTQAIAKKAATSEVVAAAATVALVGVVLAQTIRTTKETLIPSEGRTALTNRMCVPFSCSEHASVLRLMHVTTDPT